MASTPEQVVKVVTPAQLLTGHDPDHGSRMRFLRPARFGERLMSFHIPHDKAAWVAWTEDGWLAWAVYPEGPWHRCMTAERFDVF